LQDQDDFFKTLSPDKQNLYKDFRIKWARDVEKYNKASSKVAKSKVIRNLSEGNFEEVSSKDIENAFKNPGTKTQRILEDIGKSGINNIVYNSLLGLPKGDANALAKAIINARNTKGLSKYFTKEHEDFANNLLKRSKYKKSAQWMGGILGTGILAGAGLKLGKNALSE